MSQASWAPRCACFGFLWMVIRLRDVEQTVNVLERQKFEEQPQHNKAGYMTTPAGAQVHNRSHCIHAVLCGKTQG